MKLIIPLLLVFIQLGIAKANFEEKFESSFYRGYSEIPTDFTLEVSSPNGKTVSFRLHSSALAKIRRFSAILGNDYLETRERIISFPSDSIDSFKRILYFIYQNEIDFDEDIDLLELLKLQEQLIVDGLDQILVEKLNDEDFLSSFTEEDLAKMLNFLKVTPLRHKNTFTKNLLKYISKNKKIQKNCTPKLIKYVNDDPELTEQLTEIFEQNNNDNIKARRELQAANKKQKEREIFLAKVEKVLQKTEKRLNKVFKKTNFNGKMIPVSSYENVALAVKEHLDRKYPGAFKDKMPLRDKSWFDKYLTYYLVLAEK